MPSIHVNQGIKGKDVVTVMEKLRLLKDRCQNGFRLIIAANSFPRSLINGRMSMVLLLTSPGQENHRTML